MPLEASSLTKGVFARSVMLGVIKASLSIVEGNGNGNCDGGINC